MPQLDLPTVWLDAVWLDMHTLLDALHCGPVVLPSPLPHLSWKAGGILAELQDAARTRCDERRVLSHVGGPLNQEAPHLLLARHAYLGRAWGDGQLRVPHGLPQTPAQQGATCISVQLHALTAASDAWSVQPQEQRTWCNGTTTSARTEFVHCTDVQLHALSRCVCVCKNSAHCAMGDYQSVKS